VIRFRSIGSGSGGNATVVEASSGITTTRLLVDAGFSLKELDLRLARAGLGACDLDAVFVTHEHGDHIGCALTLAERAPAPLDERGTARHQRLRCTGDAALRATPSRSRSATSSPSLHRRPRRSRAAAAALRRRRRAPGRLTDLGSITAHMIGNVADCDAIVLECNHDAAMLATRHASLKARIGSRFGHLSNATGRDPGAL
jgi:phosphoribosyl 1,2-cyclic phosphodiesterase